MVTCPQCNQQVAPAALVFTPAGTQVCNSCASTIDPVPAGSEAKMRAWGCGIVLAGVFGYIVGSMFLSVIGGIIGAVLAAGAVTMLKTSMAKNQVY